jgi:hypothetical protein
MSSSVEKQMAGLKVSLQLPITLPISISLFSSFVLVLKPLLRCQDLSKQKESQLAGRMQWNSIVAYISINI